jgi:hypothetical protein
MGQGLRVMVKKRTGDWAPVREYYSTYVLVSQVHKENWGLADQADGAERKNGTQTNPIDG